jgi:hypothetical protein
MLLPKVSILTKKKRMRSLPYICKCGAPVPDPDGIMPSNEALVAARLSGFYVPFYCRDCCHKETDMVWLPPAKGVVYLTKGKKYVES